MAGSSSPPGTVNELLKRDSLTRGRARNGVRASPGAAAWKASNPRLQAHLNVRMLLRPGTGAPRRQAGTARTSAAFVLHYACPVLRVGMGNFFARNIDRRGRIVRAVWGLALIVAGVLVWPRSAWICVALAAAGAFALYEAVRGWCVMRACGIKTKL